MALYTLHPPLAACCLVCRFVKLPVEVSERWSDTHGRGPPPPAPKVLVTYCQEYSAALIRLPHAWWDYLNRYEVQVDTSSYDHYQSRHFGDPAMFVYVNLAKHHSATTAMLCGLRQAIQEKLPGGR